MSNVDIEIYMANLVKFFDNNPEQLKILIGDIDGDVFFEKVRNVCELNDKDEKELAPTRKQMIEIILEIKKGPDKKNIEKNVTLFMDHHMGKISLN
jgi:succinate dehydrogenase/fumarate reductase flavoprotein subunit